MFLLNYIVETLEFLIIELKVACSVFIDFKQTMMTLIFYFPIDKITKIFVLLLLLLICY